MDLAGRSSLAVRVSEDVGVELSGGMRLSKLKLMGVFCP